MAVGIALDVIYSRRMGFLETSGAERVLKLIEDLGFDIYANELQHADSEGGLLVLRGLEEFREHLGGRLTVTLLRGIGQGFEVHELHPPTIVASIQELEERARRSGLQRVVNISAC